MKAKISPDLISFPAIRRGDWIIKVSVFKNKQIMICAHHYYNCENTMIQTFLDQNEAVHFIDYIVEKYS